MSSERSTKTDIHVQFSVGSYVLARFKLENIPPRCTIFAFQLILNQTRTIVPIKEFIADNLDLGETGVKCPTESILLHTEGTLPKVSHPEMDAYPVLVKGRQDDGQDEQGDGQEEQGDGQRTLDWQSNQIRMPAEKKVRSSTFEGWVFSFFFLVSGQLIPPHLSRLDMISPEPSPRSRSNTPSTFASFFLYMDDRSRMNPSRDPSKRVK